MAQIVFKGIYDRNGNDLALYYYEGSPTDVALHKYEDFIDKLKEDTSLTAKDFKFDYSYNEQAFNSFFYSSENDDANIYNTANIIKLCYGLLRHSIKMWIHNDGDVYQYTEANETFYKFNQNSAILKNITRYNAYIFYLKYTDTEEHQQILTLNELRNILASGKLTIGSTTYTLYPNQAAIDTLQKELYLSASNSFDLIRFYSNSTNTISLSAVNTDKSIVWPEEFLSDIKELVLTSTGAGKAYTPAFFKNRTNYDVTFYVKDNKSLDPTYYGNLLDDIYKLCYQHIEQEYTKDTENYKPGNDKFLKDAKVALIGTTGNEVDRKISGGFIPAKAFYQNHIFPSNRYGDDCVSKSIAEETKIGVLKSTENNDKKFDIYTYLYKEPNTATPDFPYQFIECQQNQSLPNNIDVDDKTTYLTNYFGENIVLKLVFLTYFEFDKCKDFTGPKVISSSSQYSMSQHNLYRYTATCYKNPALQSQANGIKIENAGDKSGAFTIEKFKEAYVSLRDIVQEVFDNLVQNFIDQQNKQNANEKLEESVETVETYVAARKAGAFQEDAFFYNTTYGLKKRVPMNPFVSVEFKVPKIKERKNNNYNTYEETWISVSTQTARDPINEERDGVYYFQPGNYFESFDLEDEAGARKITLTLRSYDDFNLENIIYGSLALDEMMTDFAEGINDTSELSEERIKRITEISSNFRVTFGYRDGDDYDEKTYKSRTEAKGNTVSKTYKYPTEYFKITNVEIKNIEGSNEMDYVITGLCSANYLFDSFTVNNAKDLTGENGTPKNVFGTVAGTLYAASNGKIAVLGSSSDTIITGYDGAGGYDTIEIEEADESSKLQKSDIDFSDLFFVENGVALSNGNQIYKDLSQMDFTFATEDDTVSSLTIRQLLDKVCAYIPPRIYYLCKDNNNETVAAAVDYESIRDYGMKKFFKQFTVKVEPIQYQIIEKDAKFSGETEKSKKYFIRFFFEGPTSILVQDKNGMTAKVASKEQSEVKNYLRTYNYKFNQNQLIKSLTVNNGGLTLGNISTIINVMGLGNTVSYSFKNKNKENSGNLTEENYTQAMKDFYKNSDHPYLTSNINVVGNVASGDTTTEMNKETTEGKQISMAMKKYAALQNQAYEADMTIVGDPFYRFDDVMSPCNYEIYLNISRLENLKTSSRTSSFFSGIYLLKKITHSMSGTDTGFEYTTKLEMFKLVM